MFNRKKSSAECFSWTVDLDSGARRSRTPVGIPVKTTKQFSREDLNLRGYKKKQLSSLRVISG